MTGETDSVVPASASNVLVTGGAGFIGSCFVRQRLRTNNANEGAGASIAGDPCEAQGSVPPGTVVVLDNLAYSGSRLSLPDHHPRLRFVHGDVCDRELVAKLLADYAIQQVVHLAAETHVDRSIDSAEPFLQSNVVGTARLLEASLQHWRQLPEPARSRFRLLHVSTDEVYGSLGESGSFVETTPYDPSSPYSASKAAADHFARAYYRTYGLPVMISNCSNNFGPYQFPEKLIPVMILNAYEGRELPVYGDGRQVRDWLHVEDHVGALELILQAGKPGESYNIGGDCERRNVELVEAICDCVDRLRPNLPHAPCRNLIRYVEDRPGHDRRYAIDSSKLQQTLGWQCRSRFEDRLEETVQWYLDNSQWLADLGVHRQRRGLNVSNKPQAEA